MSRAWAALAFPLLIALAASLAPHARAASVDASVRSPDGHPVADVAVVLEPLVAPAPHGHPKSPTPFSIEQRGAEFLPWVSVVQTGSAVSFPNNDTVRHHVYSFSPARHFEIKLYVGKPAQPIVFDKPGEVVIGCNIHDWMQAHVLVVDTPWSATSNADGRAQVAGVPPGRYRLRLWHPLQMAALPDREIEVGPAPLQLDLVMDARPRERKPHTDLDPDHY